MITLHNWITNQFIITFFSIYNFYMLQLVLFSIKEMKKKQKLKNRCWVLSFTVLYCWYNKVLQCWQLKTTHIYICITYIMTRKDPDAGKVWRQEEKGMTEGEEVGPSLTRWTWAWGSFERRWTEKPGGLQSMGSQRVGRNWATWQQHNLFRIVTYFLHQGDNFEAHSSLKCKGRRKCHLMSIRNVVRSPLLLSHGFSQKVMTLNIY